MMDWLNTNTRFGGPRWLAIVFFGGLLWTAFHAIFMAP